MEIVFSTYNVLYVVIRSVMTLSMPILVLLSSTVCFLRRTEHRNVQMELLYLLDE